MKLLYLVDVERNAVRFMNVTEPQLRKENDISNQQPKPVGRRPTTRAMAKKGKYFEIFCYIYKD